MPTNSHLKWTEVTDFAPGLWTEATFNMPAQALQQMDDAMPDLAGGIKAAMKGTAVSVTGLPTGSTITIKGFYTIGAQGASGSDLDRFIVLHNTSGNKVQLWELPDGTTTWVQRGSDIATGGNTPNAVVFDTFTDASSVPYLVFNIFQTAAQDGVWALNRNTNAVTRVLSGTVTAVAVQDDRVIAALGPTLRWTDSQSVTSWPAANNLPVQISQQGANIVLIRPNLPSDLLLGMQQAPWVSVQGGIDDPVVQQMSDAHVPGSIEPIALSDLGIIFTASRQGLYVTGDGSSFQSLSDQLDRSNFLNPRQDFLANWIFHGSGNVYDLRTKSWFKLSPVGGSAWHVSATRGSNEVDFATYSSNNPVIYSFKTDDTSLATTWTIKTAPLEDPDGRQIEIREVQVYLRAFNSAATATITVGGVSMGPFDLVSGGQQISWIGLARAEYLDITITVDSTTSAEAPRLERLRIGSQPGHLLAHG